MVLRLKDSPELKTYRGRILRLAGLGRITKTDADNLVRMVDEIDAYVIKMPEQPNREAAWF